LINHSVGYDAYLYADQSLTPGHRVLLLPAKPRPVQLTIREDARPCIQTLRVIHRDLHHFALACFGVWGQRHLLSTNGWASRNLLTRDQYREFGEPQYDLEFLDAHQAGENYDSRIIAAHTSTFDQLASYPYTRSAGGGDEGNPDLAEGRSARQGGDGRHQPGEECCTGARVARCGMEDRAGHRKDRWPRAPASLSWLLESCPGTPSEKPGCLSGVNWASSQFARF